MKQLMELQQKMKKKQDELRNIHIEAEDEGATVVISAEMEVIEVTLSDDLMQNKKKAQEVLVKVFNKGLTKAKTVAADNMKDIMGDMGLGGLAG